MSAFNLETLYPVQVNGSHTSVHSNQSTTQILYAFDDLRWRQYRLIQLQLSGVKTSMTITNEASSQWMRIELLTVSESGHIEFKIDTNVNFFTTRKDVFGLVKIKVKHTIQFERVELSATRRYLELFLLESFEQLENEYKEIVMFKKNAA